MEADGEVFPCTSLLGLLGTAAAGSLQPLLVPHILLVETHHHLSLITRDSEGILHNGQQSTNHQTNHSYMYRCRLNGQEGREVLIPEKMRM